MAIPGAHPPAGRAQLVQAFAANAPASTSAELLVTIPSFGGSLTSAFAWAPRYPLPVVGDECLVAYDEKGQPWVVEWVGATTPLPTLVSALPASPRDGQEVYFQNATMAAEGVAWHLRYRAASASAHKWEFVGGSPMVVLDLAERIVITTGASEYKAPNGSSFITIPIAGDYDLTVSIRILNASGTTNFAMGVNTTAAPGTLLVSMFEAATIAGASAAYGNLTETRRAANLAAAAHTIGVAAEAASVTYKVLGAELRARPVRVG